MVKTLYKEEDLFLPIKIYFEGLGYQIDGEVMDCDILMVKNHEFIAIELKTELNLKLLIQGAKRQKLFEYVFVGIWAPSNMRSKAFKDKVYILNRLGIGLIVVSKKAKQVSIYCDATIHPLEIYQKRNQKVSNRVKTEFNRRRQKSNIGGVKGTKLLTSYKEDCLIILDFLVNKGPMKASNIKRETGIETSYNKVYNNHYDWFVKEDKGIYKASEEGHKAYEDNIKLIEELRRHL